MAETLDESVYFSVFLQLLIWNVFFFPILYFDILRQKQIKRVTRDPVEGKKNSAAVALPKLRKIQPFFWLSLLVGSRAYFFANVCNRAFPFFLADYHFCYESAGLTSVCSRYCKQKVVKGGGYNVRRNVFLSFYSMLSVSVHFMVMHLLPLRSRVNRIYFVWRI